MKLNDWIVAKINNPTYDVLDFKYISDLTLDNTLLLPKNAYVNSSLITLNPLFLNDNGEFNQSLFDTFYSKAASEFKDFSAEDEMDNYQYSMWDVRKPKNGKVKNPNFNLSSLVNPDHIRVGAYDFNQITPSDKSRRELAQNSRIYDPATNTWSNTTVNDISLLSSPFEYIASLFDEPLVYATYDEDTYETDPYTGKQVLHQKGEWKVNDEGEYYTERLNGRSLVGKSVVSAMDYLTSENSAINKYDAFDSDDLDKSVTGTIVKNIAAYAPVLIPYVGQAYAGLMVGREISKSLPMLYGMVTGLFGAEKTDSLFLNTVAAYGQKFTGSTSDYSQNNTFTFENIGNMISDVALLWGQQKFIANTFSKLTSGGERAVQTAYVKAQAEYASKTAKAFEEASKGNLSLDKLSAYIGTTNFSSIKQDLIDTGKWVDSAFGKSAIAKYVTPAQLILANRIKTGLDLSLAYMAIISNTDVYDTVLQKGGSPFEAAAIALGSTIGMFSVDKYLHLGEMFFNEDVSRKAIREAAVNSAEELMSTAGYRQAVDVTTKKGLIGLIQRGIDSGKRAVSKYENALKEHTLGFAGKALGEGVEEVSEEIVTDLTKSLGELAGRLGYFSQTDYGAWDNMLERYGMSLLGGAAGGGLFYTKYAIENRGKNNQAFQNDLVYLLRNGKKDEILSELARLKDNNQLGDKNLSTEYTTNDNGDKVYLTADSDHQSQSDYIYNTLVTNINLLDIILNGSGLRLNEDELFDKMVQGEFQANALALFLADRKQVSYITNYLQDFLNLANQIINKQKEIDNYINGTPDPAKRGTEFQEKLSKLKQEQQELLDQRDYLFGEGSLGYVEKMLFAIDLGVSGPLVSLSKELYAQNNFGKSISELTSAEKTTLDKQFEDYSKNTKKSTLDSAFKIFKAMQKKVNPSVQALNQLDLSKSIELFKLLIAEDPYSKQKGLYDALDGETNDDIAKLQLQEGESDEDYQTRMKEREAKVKEYNQSHINEWIDKFTDLNLDKHSLRLLHSKIGVLKNEVIKSIASKFLVSNNPSLSNSIRDAIISGANDDIIRSIIELSARDKYTSMYGNLSIVDPDMFLRLFRKLGTGRGGYEDYLTQNDIYTLFLNWLATSPDNQALLTDTENLGTNFGILSNNFLNYLYGLMQYNPNLKENNGVTPKFEGETEEEDLSRASIDYYHQVLNPEDSVILLDQFLRNAVTYSVKRSIAEANNTEFNEDGTSPVNVTDRLFENLVKSKTDEIFGNNIDFINKIRSEIQNNGDLKTLDKLERIKLVQNPALSVVNQINDSESFLESIYELFLKGSDEFVLTEEQINKLKQLSHDMEVAKAFIKAASTEGNLNSPIGHNKYLNDYVKRHSDVFKSFEELPELNSDTAYLLINELEDYQKEMLSWFDLSNKNKGNQLKSLIESKQALQTTKLELYLQNRDAFKISPEVDLLEGIEDITLDGSFQAVVSVESLLHNNYLKALSKGFTLEQILDSLIPKICNLARLNYQEHTNLDENLKYKNYSDYDKLMLIISNFAVNDKDFYSKLLDTINKNEGFVPIKIQEEVLKIVDAHRSNLDLINRALRYVNSKLEVKLPVLPNVSIVTGVAGAGKSYIISNVAANDETTWISGPTQNLIDKLSEGLSKAKQVTKEDLLKLVLGPDYPAFISEITDISGPKPNKFFNLVKGLKGYKTLQLKEGVTFSKVDNPPKELVIDEASHFSTGEMLAIAHWAELNGVHVTAIAGSTQNGYSKDHIENITSESVLAWRTPNLFISLRTNNNLKNQNLKLLDIIINQLDKIDNSDQSEQAVKELEAVGITLHYYNGTTFAGEQITPKLGDVSKLSGTIAFIGTESSENYKKLQEAGLKPEIIDPLNVQGLEYDYVVVDKNWNFGNLPFEKFKGLRDLYTMVSRSKKGTIIIKNNLPSWIVSKEDDYTSESNTIAKALPIFRKAILEELNNTKFTDEIAPKTKSEEPKKPEEEPIKEDLSEETKAVENNQPLNAPQEEESYIQEQSQDVITSNNEAVLEKYPIRVYGNVSFSGIEMNDSEVNGKTIHTWTNSSNSNADLGIFIGKEDTVIDPKDQENFVRLLLLIKCLFHYGTDYYGKAVDTMITSRFSKENFDEAKFFIKIEEANDSNLLVGLTDLENSKRAIGNGRIVKLIAKFNDRNGNPFEVSLGAFANPETWKKGLNTVKESLKKQIEEGNTELLEYYNNLDALVDSYETWVNNSTISNQEIEVDKPNFSKLTSLIPKPELRLENIDPMSHFSPYKYASHYSVDSPVYIITKDDLSFVNPELMGKAVMFSSSNVFLSPGALRDKYIEEKQTGESGSVRMIVLDNLGVSFRSLYEEKYKGIYTTVAGKNKFYTPFKSASTGARMYIGMWNFRANLKNFNARVKAFKESSKLSNEDINNLCLLDNRYYNEIRESDGQTLNNGSKYLDEETYRQKVILLHPDDAAALKQIWDFNDSLGGSVREFRLGYNKSNGAYIRKLTHLEPETIYLDINNVNGIYINPEIAEFYEQILDRLFTNIYDKIITIDKAPNVLLDKSKLKKGWYKVAKKTGKISIPILLNDNIDSPEVTTIEFDGEQALSAIASLTTQIGKFLHYERLYPDFLQRISLKSSNSKWCKLFYGDEQLDWISVIPDTSDLPAGITLEYATPTGEFDESTVGVGVKPYSNLDGKPIGYWDAKIDNLFSLMFHGLIDLQTPNDFTKGDIRATDAPFKYGFMSDPLLVNKVGDGATFAGTVTLPKFFGSNVVCGLPIIGVYLKPKTAETQRKPVSTQEKPEINPLLVKIDEYKKKLGITSNINPDAFESEEEVEEFFISKVQDNLDNCFLRQRLPNNLMIWYNNDFKTLDSIIPNISSITYIDGHFEAATSDGKIYDITLNRKKLNIQEQKIDLDPSSFESQVNQWLKDNIFNQEGVEESDKADILDFLNSLCALAEGVFEARSSNYIINALKAKLEDDGFENLDELDKFRINC